MDYFLIFKKLKSTFPKTKIFQNHPLAPYTTVKIGGPADIFIETKNDDKFLEILKFIVSNPSAFQAPPLDRGVLTPNLTSPLSRGDTAKPRGVLNPPITILGNGSNVLISDSGIRGIVIKNNSQNIEILKNNQVKISSGVQLAYVINFLAEKHISGLEEFAYIPSTVGGAIYGNIHSIENNFSKYLESIEIFDLQKSEICNLKSDKLTWNYDSSEFQNNPNLIILSAVFNLKKGKKQEIKSKANEIIIKKTPLQPMNSLGSVFKNPSLKDCQKIWGEQKSAGWIIDHELNWKGKSIGQAKISPLHANFIVNNRNCTAKDYYTLAHSIQTEVFKRFKLKLEFEIKFLGKF